MSETVPVFVTPSPRIRKVALDRPWMWLARGWEDLVNVPRASLSLGLVLFAISVVLTAGLLLAGHFYLLLPLLAGFFLISPLLACAVYEVSRCRERGEPVDALQAVAAIRRNLPQIALMGLILMLLHLAWVRLATLLFALFFQSTTPPLDRLIDLIFFSSVSLPFLVTGTLIGGVLATLAFAISVISIPMLLDRDVSVFTAIATSWTSVRLNWQAMALWAALIVIFTGLGFATLYIGLIVALPLIGHASWHAYRDLVE